MSMVTMTRVVCMDDKRRRDFPKAVKAIFSIRGMHPGGRMQQAYDLRQGAIASGEWEKHPPELKAIVSRAILGISTEDDMAEYEKFTKRQKREMTDAIVEDCILREHEIEGGRVAQYVKRIEDIWTDHVKIGKGEA